MWRKPYQWAVCYAKHISGREIGSRDEVAKSIAEIREKQKRLLKWRDEAEMKRKNWPLLDHVVE